MYLEQKDLQNCSPVTSDVAVIKKKRWVSSGHWSVFVKETATKSRKTQANVLQFKQEKFATLIDRSLTKTSSLHNELIPSQNQAL